MKGFLRAAASRGVRVEVVWGCLVLAGCREDPRPLATPSPAASQPAPHRDILGERLKKGARHHSQHNEEFIIRDFFQDRRGGFFLDVGCAWPKEDSNTYFLERKLGWSGIGVDALPEYGPLWASERPRSRFFSFAVSDRDGAFVTFYRSELTGVSSLTSPRSGPAGRAGQKARQTELRVPTTTLTRLLDDNGVASVDLLSLDIEGAELLALAGFDIDRFRPELVCVEWHHAGRDELLAYFAAHGYGRLERYLPHDGANDYFAPKTTPGSSAPAPVPPGR